MESKTLSVALDISRLLLAIEKDWFFTGITKYTELLFKHLVALPADGIEIVPVLPIAQAMTINREIRQSFRSIFNLTPLFLSASQPDSNLPNFDIFHATASPLPKNILTGSAKRVLTIHDCIHAKFPAFYQKPSSPPIATILNSLSPESDYAICVSEATRADFLSLVPMEMHATRVIPQAAETLFFNTGLASQTTNSIFDRFHIRPRQYILALAQAEPRKNIARLIQSFSHLVKNNMHRNMVLVLVAHNQYLAHFKTLLLNNNLSENDFRVIPNVEQQSLAQLYANAEVFVYVSLYEGFGLPVLEAMATGCPVLVSNTSSLPEVAGAAGYYVDPWDVDAIAAGLATLIAAPDIRNKLSNAGKLQAAQFSWEKTAQQTLDFYREISDACGDVPH